MSYPKATILSRSRAASGAAINRHHQALEALPARYGLARSLPTIAAKLRWESKQVKLLQKLQRFSTKCLFVSGILASMLPLP